MAGTRPQACSPMKVSMVVQVLGNNTPTYSLAWVMCASFLPSTKLAMISLL